MKSVQFEPIRSHVHVHTNSNILEAILAKELDVLMACGGKGLCATCHVHVESGERSLTPRTEREQRTLGRITGCNSQSRLACQARVVGDGVVIRLPDGMYIEKAEDLMKYLGTRAASNVLHPIDGSILIEKGKIITKSRIRDLQSLNIEVNNLKESA